MTIYVIQIFVPQVWKMETCSMNNLSVWVQIVHGILRVRINNTMCKVHGEWFSLGFAGYLDSCWFQMKILERWDVKIEIDYLDSFSSYNLIFIFFNICEGCDISIIWKGKKKHKYICQFFECRIPRGYPFVLFICFIYKMLSYKPNRNLEGYEVIR